MKFATCMAVVFASAVSAQAGQPVSVNALNAVGLSNVVVMSDAQGTQIRAKGKPLIGDPAGVRLFRLPMVTPRIESPSMPAPVSYYLTTGGPMNLGEAFNGPY